MSCASSARRCGSSAYTVAVVSTLLAALARACLTPLLSDAAPLMLFILPVMAAAWYGGVGPGVAASILGALIGDFFFLRPTFSFWIDDPRDRLAFGILVAVGLQISWLCESLHRARRRVELEQDRLRQHEQFLQSIVDNSGTIIFVKDTSGRYLLVNRQFCDVFRTTPEAMKERTDFDTFPRDVAERFMANDRQVLESQQVSQREEVVSIDGAAHTYLVAKFRLIDADGQPYAVCGIATDVTELKRLSETLRQSRERLRLANAELEERVAERTRELQDALNNVRRLEGLLPICAWCKRIRDDDSSWHQLEQYVTAHSEAVFTHSMCPECLKRELAAIECQPK